jgi:hypothetical protein
MSEPCVPDDDRRLADAAAAIERGLARPGWIEALDDRTLQRLLSALVRAFHQHGERGGVIPPFPPPGVGAPTPTASEVCLTCTQMLDAVSVEVFELAMWKTWTVID